MPRRALVVGNWKMHGSRESVASLLEALKHGCEIIEIAELAVLPPFIFIEQCERALMRTQIAWGAQDVNDQFEGAYTGEISAKMLRDFHCHYVLVGHSERRHLYGEGNELVAKKFQAAMKTGISPILCVGETEAQRASDQTFKVIQEQLAAVLSLDDNLAALEKAVVAYEPVWAIGTGNNATPEQAQDVHRMIREYLQGKDPRLADLVRIIYGGSVKPDNAGELLSMPDIDGALVGGASLNAEQFLEIGKRCKNLS